MKHLIMNLRRPTGWLLALGLLLLALVATAQDVPPRPNPPRLVNDLAGMLRPDEVDQLERKLVAYNDSTSSQIAVVTVPSLGDYDIFDYAQKLYQAWGIGQKSNNNGVLLLVAKQERKARIHTGYGLEGAIPDAISKRIISNTIVPAFKQERYYDGLNRATDQLISLAQGEYKADQTTRQRASDDDSGSGITFWLVIGVLILFILFRNRGGGSGGRRNRGFGGSMIPPLIFGDFSGGRGTFGGGGGGFGGGGFGGFGGGSSGGGGASGSW
ncbi:TPM domain-containing protein [Hymenobacter lapidiphilus]|uniref:TPM domain-containing protein n=1 Tax=Hymenobacter lapidiphilus TaxID=2608003 RepID=A0A7Y7PN43_9BACT|nr:TPM domain-containing protein [Hymenobacter lapidiphilus]NVO30880.1 TPM domain-containing protein [Hymenobacter lapidiphilus]